VFVWTKYIAGMKPFIVIDVIFSEKAFTHGQKEKGHPAKLG
jgi:hypothetical protein